MNYEVPKSEKIAYGGGLLGQNMIYNFMSMYIMFYFTDLLMIPTQAATIIVIIASLWDAMNDPMMGLLTDRTRTKWGKFRPYMIIGPVIIACTTIFCFLQYDVAPTTTIILAAISYILWGMSYTICDIPIWAITSSVSHEPDERNIMVTLGRIGGTIGTVLVTVGSIHILNLFGGERVASAYTFTAAIIAIIGAILMIIAGLKVKERIQPDKEVISIKQNMKTVTHNKPLMALMMALLVTNLVNGIRQSVQLYFVVYVWGDANYVTPVGLSLVIGMTLGMVVAPMLVKKFPKKKLFFIFSIIGSITSIVPFFGGREDVMLGLIFLGFSFACTGVISIVCSTMLLDAVEYSEWKLGYRGEGIIFSINTLLTKLSATIAKLILGVGLIMMCYVDNQTVTPLIQTGFSSMMYVIPAISFIIAMIPMMFYNLTDQQRIEIHEELEAKRKEAGK
ncbi:MFS transporter [Tannockella kyphosi]|uniref:MFS transporter n=1 Tax=Tannockella kyphosi TaxID=2899121 RepID=UPI0020123614|nr:glycoside-pentoside-hexuronide (GPH):cation symporter [Tannockella kyphosi]